MTKLLSNPYLALAGTVILLIISAGHAIKGFVTGELRFFLMDEPYSLASHPVYYSFLMAFWVVLFAAMLLGGWHNLQEVRRKR